MSRSEDPIRLVGAGTQAADHSLGNDALLSEFSVAVPLIPGHISHAPVDFTIVFDQQRVGPSRGFLAKALISRNPVLAGDRSGLFVDG
jgi:hypothetical protein